MKQATFNIACCYQCPYLGTPPLRPDSRPQSLPDFYCRAPDGLCLTTIPDWCPLPDAPDEEAV